jgi:M6 family metalloprotease-like protein
MTIPFFNEEFTFRQPDGTELRVRGTGDETSAIFETLDGYTVVKNQASGFYEYAVQSEDGNEIQPLGVQANAVAPDLLSIPRGVRPSAESLLSLSLAPSRLPRSPMRWEIRREERRNALRASVTTNILPAPPERQTIGNFVGLCLLVQCPDVPGTISRDEVEDYCNSQGYSGFGNNGSVRDYFHDNSKGKLSLTHIVAPYYTTKNPQAYYTNPKIGYGTRAQEIIREALDFHSKNGFDFSSLSTDDAEFVFATSVYYAGKRVNEWSEGLWPHAHHLNTRIELAPNTFAHDYQITDITDELRLGTFCHELGHLLCDFPDLYDKKPFRSSGIGAYCLMCAGNNANQKNPTQVSGYLKYAAGWIDDVTEIADETDISLRADRNEFAILRKDPAEYFLIENRAKDGRDAALPDEGLAIWHVDELGDNSQEQMKPASAEHFECSLEQADGKNELEKGQGQGNNGDLFHAGFRDQFSDSTSPSSRWWDGTPSGLLVRKISAAGPSMSFSAGSGPKGGAEAGVS